MVAETEPTQLVAELGRAEAVCLLRAAALADIAGRPFGPIAEATSAPALDAAARVREERQALKAALADGDPQRVAEAVRRGEAAVMQVRILSECEWGDGWPGGVARLIRAAARDADGVEADGEMEAGA